MLIDKLIEQIKLCPEDYKPVTDFCDVDYMEEAKCFYISWSTWLEIVALLDGKFTGAERIKMARAPFPLCFFEIDSAPGSKIRKSGIIVHGIEEDGEGIAVMSKIIGINDVGFVFDYHYQGYTYAGDIRVGSTNPEEVFTDESSDICIDNMDVLVNILYMINCPNLVQESVSELTQLNRARVKRGKPPLKEYSTITLDLNKEERESIKAGNTHNSPKSHLRRGHFRHLANKIVWVRNCIVGSGARVKQKYEIKGQCNTNT